MLALCDESERRLKGHILNYIAVMSDDSLVSLDRCLAWVPFEMRDEEISMAVFKRLDKLQSRATPEMRVTINDRYAAWLYEGTKK